MPAQRNATTAGTMIQMVIVLDATPNTTAAAPVHATQTEAKLYARVRLASAALNVKNAVPQNYATAMQKLVELTRMVS